MMANMLICLILCFPSQQEILLDISPDQPELASHLKLRIQRMNLLGEAPKFRGSLESTGGEKLILKNLSIEPDGNHWSLRWDKAKPETFEITLRKHDQPTGISIIAIFGDDQKEQKVTWSNFLSPVPIPQTPISNPSNSNAPTTNSYPFLAILLLIGIALGCASILFLGIKKPTKRTDLKARLSRWLEDPQQHNWKEFAPILEQLKTLTKENSDLGEKIKVVEELRFSGQNPDIQKIRELFEQSSSAFNE